MKSNAGSIDLKKLLCVSEGSSKEKSDRVSYSKETLIILSRNPPCHARPDCLSERCLGDDGLWDPEKWFQSFERSSINEALPRKIIEHIDSREENDVVLGPQRRSFQGGCHVASKEKPSTSYSRSVSSSSKLSERGSKLSHQQDHEPHSKRFHLQNGSSDWSRKDADKRNADKFEPSYSRKSRHSDYKRYVPPNASRRYSESNYDDPHSSYYEEIEPEWISYGPKSQSDTIELGGFDGPSDDFSWMGREIPMDDVPERMKKHRSENAESKEPKNSLEDGDKSGEALEEEDEFDEPLESEENEGLALEAGDQNNNDIKDEEKIEEEVKSEGTPATSEETKAADTEPPLDNELFSTENDPSKESRFSRWFSHDPNVIKSDTPTDFTSDDKLVESLTLSLLNLKEEDPVRSAIQQQSPQPTQLQQQRSQIEVSKASEIEAPATTVQQPSTPRSMDIQSADAFNRLIASIRQSDKVKEQMQQRNQQIQKLQTMMNTNKARSGNCYNVSSIESPLDSGGKSLKSNPLKLQLEKQKDAYLQKMRQIEQKNQKSSPTMFSGSDLHSLQMNKGMLPSFTIQNSNAHRQDPLDERAAATASLAAKLAGKTKEEPPKTNPPMLERLYSSQPQSTQHILNEQVLLEKETLAKLQRLQSNPSDSSPRNPTATPNNLKNNSLVIAQMLASAGVTEEQLKQLTLEQQELVIAMVQNQFTHKDIGKYVNLDLRNNVKLPEGTSRSPIPTQPAGPFVSASKDLYASKTLPIAAASGRVVKSGQAALPSSTHTLSFLSDTSTSLPLRNDANVSQGVPTSAFSATQSASMAQAANAQTRLLSRNLLPVQPAAIIPPVVPLVSPNIGPRMLTHTLAAPPHLTPLVQTPTPLAAPPHPAVLLQLQQQLYANQLAVQQQHHQVALAAAIQKQQLAAAAQAQQQNDAAKLQQSVQNLRLGMPRASTSDGSGAERTQFNNPLAQWFSSDILRQSQFPPVSQLTGQQTMKLSNVPHGMDAGVHSTKQH